MPVFELPGKLTTDQLILLTNSSRTDLDNSLQNIISHAQICLAQKNDTEMKVRKQLFSVSDQVNKTILEIITRQ